MGRGKYTKSDDSYSQWAETCAWCGGKGYKDDGFSKWVRD